LELRDICANNVITKTSELAQVTTHIIGDPVDTVLTPLFTLSVGVIENCISVANLSWLNTYLDTYNIDNDGTGSPMHAFVKSFDTPSRGVLTVSTNDIAKYSIQKEFYMRITINLPESITTQNVITYPF